MYTLLLAKVNGGDIGGATGAAARGPVVWESVYLKVSAENNRQTTFVSIMVYVHISKNKQTRHGYYTFFVQFIVLFSGMQGVLPGNMFAVFQCALIIC